MTESRNKIISADLQVANTWKANYGGNSYAAKNSSHVIEPNLQINEPK